MATASPVSNPPLGSQLTIGAPPRFIADAPATMLVTDSEVLFSSIAASRAVTLPAASTFSLGDTFLIGDASGSASGANTIVVTRAGSDTINGATTKTIGSAFGSVTLMVTDVTASGKFLIIAHEGTIT